MPVYMDRDGEEKDLQKLAKDNPNKPCRAYSVRLTPIQGLYLIQRWKKAGAPDSSMSSTIVDTVEQQRLLDERGFGVVMEQRARDTIRLLADKMGVSPEDLCRRILVENIGNYAELAEEVNRSYEAVRRVKIAR